MAHQGAGHISLVYVVGKHSRDGAVLAEQARDLVVDRTFRPRSVIVEWGPKDAAHKERAEVFFKGCGPTAHTSA